MTRAIEDYADIVMSDGKAVRTRIFLPHDCSVWAAHASAAPAARLRLGWSVSHIRTGVGVGWLDQLSFNVAIDIAAAIDHSDPAWAQLSIAALRPRGRMIPDCATVGMTDDLKRSLILAVAPFAEQGAVPLWPAHAIVQWLAEHPPELVA